MSPERTLGVWFPTVRTGTGTDVFTERLVAGLQARGIRAEITWLPLRAEYAPWTVPVPQPPAWANVAHVNTWLRARFLPKHLPVVATIHHAVHDPVLRPYKGFARAAYHRWWIAPNERRVLRCANKVVAVSRYVADMARKTLCDVPMEVIYNGVDTDKFKPGTRQRQPGEPFRLLYVGSWRRLKGVDLLAPIMRELGDSFKLCYTGGPAAARVEAGMSSNMHDIGRLQGDDAVVAAMQDADALLFPSRSEGFGLVAAEAIACGLPVIATRGSSLVELVQDGISGLLCPLADVSAFVAAARKLQTNPSLTTNTGHVARRRATERFTIKQVITAYTDLYDDCSSEC